MKSVENQSNRTSLAAWWLRMAPLVPLFTILLCSSFLRWNSFAAYFTSDDGMNLVHLHGLWTKSVWSLVSAAASIFTTEYRPVGGIIYRLMHLVFGIDVLPYRVLLFAMLSLNIVLTYWFARGLMGQGAATWVALLMSYHGAFSDLYYNFGTIYDLLAYGLSVICLHLYIQRRHTLATSALLVAIHGLALGSKEIAATVPVILYLFDFLVRGRRIPTLLSLVLLLESGIFLAVKLGTTNEISANPLYAPDRSLATAARNAGYYLAKLSYLDERFGFWCAAGACLLLAGSALLLRNRLILWGGAMFVAMAIPVLTIPLRGAYVVYLPSLGLAVAAGVVLNSAMSRMAGNKRWALCGIAVFTAFHFVASRAIDQEKRAEHALVQPIVEGVSVPLRGSPPGTRLFFVEDPFRADDWILTFLLRLKLNDPSLLVERQKLVPQFDRMELGLYDYLVAARQSGITVKPNVDRVVRANEAPVLPVQFSPQRASPGETYRVAIPELPGAAIDVVYKLRIDGKVAAVGIARKWTILNEHGTAELQVPLGHPASTVEMEAVKAHGGKWTSTSGLFVVAQ